MSEDPKLRRLPQNLVYYAVFRGKAFCMPDAWGNVFAVPESHVILHTADPSYAQANPQYGSRISFDNTELDGSFDIVSTNHPPSLKNKDLYLELINRATKETYYPVLTPLGLKATPQKLGNSFNYDVGIIRTSWRANPPVIGSFNGRKFQYPAEFANVLAANAGSVRGPASLELVRFTGGQPDTYPEYDDLFRSLDRESNSRSKVITSKLAKELVPVLNLNLLKIRRSNDVFRMALEHCSITRFNLLNMDDFKGPQLGVAVTKAFGGKSAYFLGFEGRLAFCALMYAAGAVESGLKVRAAFRPSGDNHVTSIDVS